jgi:hypothetical protein
VSVLIRRANTMRLIRLSGPLVLIFVVNNASGCGNPGADVYWPTGAAVVLQDRDAPQVLGDVPIEHRAIVKRRSLAIANSTSAIIVDDPAFRALSRSSPGALSPTDPVRVRMTEGPDQAVELIVRRQDLALPGPNVSLFVFLSVPVMVLIMAAAVLAVSETLLRATKDRRAINHDVIAIHSVAGIGARELTRTRGIPITDRGDCELDQWQARVAAMSARRRAK